ncbi:hypothetical protein BO78DRAFT_416696 [Aspergillus sclerotiicarbonarius CBS 121057]|uniref:Uncharacterized protein n=1 Tax=Aspergillus sclerotiicarbonarius (strain CBS 121057 / IBT 28362) TaxID=1448318 RepID=A0A319ELK6_ASPSB|nr:hypothetical protein BO78DRAFT_416696 [Aspergillus sclerotiicarbonarius CBS 121057]
MDYTPQTLAQAKRLFLPNPKSSTTTTTTTNAPPHRHQYSLRKRSPTTTVLTSWLDEDRTDDYDPKIERAQLRQKRLAKKPKITPSLIVTVHMASQVGKEFLASLPIYQDDGPDTGGGHVEISDTCILKSDEFKIRICKPCKELGSACCSLVQNPDAFPCEQCIGSTTCCEIVLPEVDMAFRIGTQQEEEIDSFEHGNAFQNELVLNPITTAGSSTVPLLNQSPNTIQPLPSTSTPTLPPHITPPSTYYPNPNPTTTTTTTTTTASTTASTTPTTTTKTLTIPTSLTHPITFLHELKDTNLPCTFCTNFTYGLFGTGPPKPISVMDLGRGTFIPLPLSTPSPLSPIPPTTSTTPLSPSPLPSPKGTRICSIHTLTHLHILSCPTHTIIPIKSLSPTTFNFHSAYASLTLTPPVMKNPWCSICPHPAFYGCGTLQKTNRYFEEVEDGNGGDRDGGREKRGMKGCGLLLCERCEVLMRAVLARDMDMRMEMGMDMDMDMNVGMEMGMGVGGTGGNSGTGTGGSGWVEEVIRRNRIRDGVYGVRADVEFLVKGEGNVLWRRFGGGLSLLS